MKKNKQTLTQADINAIAKALAKELAKPEKVTIFPESLYMRPLEPIQWSEKN